jgi:hypothetical protein
VNIGLDQDGVIEPTRAAAVTEGAMVPVRVKAEAHAEKSVLLSLADMSPSTPRPDNPALHAKPGDDPFLRGVEIADTIQRQEARDSISAAIEEARQKVVDLEGGGNIAIEATRGMTAIDVDAANRTGGEDMILALNLAAAEEAARQIALRCIGGLVIIDFVSMSQRRYQRTVADAFRNALAGRLGRASDVLDLSKFGVCEAAIARRMRPVADALAVPAAEREALDALRDMESIGWHARGARIYARLSEAAAKWLEADHIGWKTALADRVGARWVLESVNRPAGRPEVWSA